MIDLNGKDVLVVGLGISGFAAAEVALRMGATVTATDSSDSPSMADRLGQLESAGADIRLGVSVPEDLAAFDLVVVSPGVPAKAEVLVSARAEGIEVISELEMGFQLLENEIVGVTGTNGKTTTTALLRRILDHPDRRAYACGNIGSPLVGLVGEAQPGELLVVEVSSFQLANINEFRAQVAVLLNIVPDHFDWHTDMGEYRDAKTRITENQTSDDYFIYNSDDPACKAIASEMKAVAVGFGLEREPGYGVWIEDGFIKAGPPLREEVQVMSLRDVRLKGSHNLLNVMAAVGASLAMGESPAVIRKAVGKFEGLEHRMEYVATVSKVKFYNDSKATNPNAALNAVKSFEEPMVVILGGRNKGLEFTDLMAEVCARLESGQIKGVVLIGESTAEMRESLAAVCPAVGGYRVVDVATIEEAVSTAFGIADDSGSVLLSPACASFDMFSDYKERGKAFKDSVAGLARKGRR